MYFWEKVLMNDKIIRFSVRMPIPTALMFERFAALLGYRKSTFIFACAVDGLLQKVGRQEYFDMAVAVSGDLMPEPSVDATEPTEGKRFGQGGKQPIFSPGREEAEKIGE